MMEYEEDYILLDKIGTVRSLLTQVYHNKDLGKYIESLKDLEKIILSKALQRLG